MAVNRTGKHYGRLTVICEATRNSKGKPQWLCVCGCGTEVVVAAALLSDTYGTKSCGCLQREKAALTGSATKKDRIGERVGRLLVLAEAARSKQSRARWLCRCDCGNEVEVNGSDLYEGRSTSCGCLHRERTSEANAQRIKHGHARQGPNYSRLTTPEYRSWKAMKERCRNPNAPNYHLYGGRGITVCERWSDFRNFLTDMGARPDGTTLDRIDSDGNYEPGNVRWATAKEQANNRRETPEYAAIRRASLDRGRERMWADPEIRARLVDDRHRRKKAKD